MSDLPFICKKANIAKLQQKKICKSIACYIMQIGHIPCAAKKVKQVFKVNCSVTHNFINMQISTKRNVYLPHPHTCMHPFNAPHHTHTQSHRQILFSSPCR